MDNILVSEMPTSLEVNGKKHEIESDFIFSLSTILANDDKTLVGNEKTSIMLKNLFGKKNLFIKKPENIEAAIKQCQYFLSGGEEGEGPKNSGPKLYSFSQDARLIFAAFQQTHGIDLQEVDMHWWKFLALFADLGQNTAFCQLISLRSRDHEGKLTKEEKAATRKMDNFRIDQSSQLSLAEMEIMDKVKSRYKKAKAKRNGT